MGLFRGNNTVNDFWMLSVTLSAFVVGQGMRDFCARRFQEDFFGICNRGFSLFYHYSQSSAFLLS